MVVLSNPPEAVAAHQMLGSFSYTVTAVIRPPMFAGPIERQVVWSAIDWGREDFTFDFFKAFSLAFFLFANSFAESLLPSSFSATFSFLGSALEVVFDFASFSES